MSGVSAYVKLYEELARGSRVRITGVAKATVRSKLYHVQGRLRRDALLYEIELPSKSVFLEDDMSEQGQLERAFFVSLKDPEPRRTSGMVWAVVPAGEDAQ